MERNTAHLLLLLLLLLLHPLTSVEQEEVDKVLVEVITDSTPCSATCGLGVKTQTLCLLKDGKTAIQEDDDVKGKGGAKVSEKCRVRKVSCLESWQCGLRTMTVTSGQRVEIDCLGEVMEAMGRFSWRVSWRFARGIISSDDSLFARWEAPELDRVILNPVREDDAGTYRCDVQDATYRRVKRIYWGIRVLPTGVLNLDYESSLAHWELNGEKEQTGLHHILPPLYIAVIVLIVANIGAGLLFLYRKVRRRKREAES